jgi:hypothetical protein
VTLPLTFVTCHTVTVGKTVFLVLSIRAKWIADQPQLPVHLVAQPMCL